MTDEKALKAMHAALAEHGWPLPPHIINAAALAYEAAKPTPSAAGASEVVACRMLSAAKLLYANSEGCAVNHYADDHAVHGLPGWLTDCAADIAAFETALTASPAPDAAETRHER